MPRPFKSVSERVGASLRMCSATSGWSLAMPESRESREREQIEVLRSTSFTDSHLSKLQTQTTFDINIKKILSIYFHILSKNLKASLIWHCFCGTVPEKIVNTIIVAVSILGKHEAQICKKRRGPMHKTTSWSRFTAQVLGPCHCSSLFVTGPIMSLVQLCHLCPALLLCHQDSARIVRMS